MISSSLAHFNLSSCLRSAFLLLCLSSAILFLLFSHVMGEWAHFPLHWRHFSPAGYVEGPVFIALCPTTCWGHMHIPPGWAKALFACFGFQGVYSHILPFDCSKIPSTCSGHDHLQQSVLLCLSNFLQQWLGNLGGIGWPLPTPPHLVVKDCSLEKVCNYLTMNSGGSCCIHRPLSWGLDIRFSPLWPILISLFCFLLRQFLDKTTSFSLGILKFSSGQEINLPMVF